MLNPNVLINPPTHNYTQSPLKSPSPLSHMSSPRRQNKVLHFFWWFYTVRSNVVYLTFWQNGYNCRVVIFVLTFINWVGKSFFTQFIILFCFLLRSAFFVFKPLKVLNNVYWVSLFPTEINGFLDIWQSDLNLETATTSALFKNSKRYYLDFFVWQLWQYNREQYTAYDLGRE